MNVLPILNYHGIEGKRGQYPWREGEKTYVISLSTFQTHLAHVAKSGFSSLTLGELKLWLEGKDLGKRILFTFDDGHISHFEYAAPALEEFDMSGIFFISAGLVGNVNQMDWPHLEQLLARGFEIGSHGLTHIALTHVSQKVLYDELGQSRKLLEDRLGVKVESLSIPRGFYSESIRKAASEVGYRFVFTSEFDVNQRYRDLLSLNRIAIRSETSLEEFINLTEGRLGFKKQLERMKEKTRRVVGPSIYEIFVRFKQSVMPASSTHAFSRKERDYGSRV